MDTQTYGQGICVGLVAAVVSFAAVFRTRLIISGIERDKTVADKLIYIPNDD